jgi:hypothetical protein
MRALRYVVCISLGLFLGAAFAPAIAGTVAAPESRAPDKASAPYPVQGKTSVPLYLKQLAWTGNGDTYDVRLDTENPPVALVSRDQVGTSCLLPGPLQGGAVYCWRVDSKNEAGGSDTTFAVRLLRKDAAWRNAAAPSWSPATGEPVRVTLAREGDRWSFVAGEPAGREAGATLDWATGEATSNP